MLLSNVLNMSTMASIAVGGAEQLPNQQHVCMHSPELRRLLCTRVQRRAQVVGAARTASRGLANLAQVGFPAVSNDVI